MDWNGKGLEFYSDFLDEQFKYLSSGEAKAVGELIAFYRANKDRDPNRSETELYSIRDEWVRHNAETDRVIAEGTHHEHGTFTMEEANAFVDKQDKRVELPKFNQYRTHVFAIELITSNPLV